MTNKKSVRQQGKIKLSEYFKEFKKGDNVAIIQEKSEPSAYPKRMVGSCGKVTGMRGTSVVVDIMDGNLLKTYIVKPLHLKKLA